MKTIGWLQAPKKKAKTKIGNKSKKKKKLKTTNKFPDGAEGEHEHQDYCEVSKIFIIV